MALAWFRRKVHQFWEGLFLDFGRYFRIVAVEACRPSLASSSRMRGLPQVGLAAHIRRIAETLASFAELLGRLSKTREDVKTWFEFGELDDYVSFGGRA